MHSKRVKKRAKIHVHYHENYQSYIKTNLQNEPIKIKHLELIRHDFLTLCLCSYLLKINTYGPTIFLQLG
jgi:hypothetical protein